MRSTKVSFQSTASSTPYPPRHNTIHGNVLCLQLKVTGPVARFARQIAGQGYIVAAPSSYHDFTGPEPLKYDAEDTDRGNKFKIEKVPNS